MQRTAGRIPTGKRGMHHKEAKAKAKEKTKERATRRSPKESCGNVASQATTARIAAAASERWAQGSAGASSSQQMVAGLYLAALKAVGNHHGRNTNHRLTVSVDSGVAASVLPKDTVSQYPGERDAQYGRSYESATGERVQDMGLVSVACSCQGMTRVFRARKTNVTRGLSRGLLAVKDMVDMGHRVVFDMDHGEDVSYALHKESGQRLRLIEGTEYMGQWDLDMEGLPPETADALMPLNAVRPASVVLRACTLIMRLMRIQVRTVSYHLTPRRSCHHLGRRR
eukprot:2590702-Amphidinium_carterae.2